MGRDAETNKKRRQDPSGFHAQDRFGHPVTIGSELLWLSPAGFKVQLVDVRPIMHPKAPPGTCMVKMVGQLNITFEGVLHSGRSLKLDDFVFITDRPIFDEVPEGQGDAPPAAQPGQTEPPGDTPAGDSPGPESPALISPPDAPVPDPTRKIHLVE